MRVEQGFSVVSPHQPFQSVLDQPDDDGQKQGGDHGSQCPGAHGQVGTRTRAARSISRLAMALFMVSIACSFPLITRVGETGPGDLIRRASLR